LDLHWASVAAAGLDRRRSISYSENLPAVIPPKRAWNHGRIIGQKRPLLPKHVWAIRVRLELAAATRDLALFNMAVDSKLRGCDLVVLKVADVFAAGAVKERVSILQSKTKTGSVTDLFRFFEQVVRCKRDIEWHDDILMSCSLVSCPSILSEPMLKQPQRLCTGPG